MATGFQAETSSHVHFEHDKLRVYATNIQLAGLLMKKQFGKKTFRKWQRKFFIVMDGFLLYYTESEMRSFESKHLFNIHPKGVIPLVGSQVTQTAEGSRKFAIRISSPHFEEDMTVAAENEEDCRRWFKILTDAGKVTRSNAQLGVMSQQVAQEKEQKVELVRMVFQLEQEKEAIEESANNLREEKESAEMKLKATISVMDLIKEEKSKLHERALSLQSDLAGVYKRSKETAAQLEDKERLTRRLEEENKSYEDTSSHLFWDFVALEQRSKTLEREKLSVEEKLRKEAEAAENLKNEMKEISDTAHDLQTNLLKAEHAKLLSMSELEKERKRRVKTERTLLLAEDSLKRLARAMKQSGVNVDLKLESFV